MDLLFEDLNYNESKASVLGNLKKIKEIEKEYCKISLHEGMLNADELIDKIMNQTIKVGGGIKQDESQRSTANHIEKKVVKLIHKKDEMFKLIDFYLDEFARLKEYERKIIYYACLRGVGDDIMCNKMLHVSRATYYRAKEKTIIKFAEGLKWWFVMNNKT